ncbi:MAG: formylglycine-generating enzyme family protein [Chitinivibrionia bacterium]|nr:formylglycine-generating enzyme family protein [Chitinivibrionia bacterium]
MKKLFFAVFFAGILLLFAGCDDVVVFAPGYNNNQNDNFDDGDDLNFDLGVQGSGKDGDTKTLNGIECVLVKAGTFTMGSPKNEEWRNIDETQRKVTLTQDFWISKYPITDALFYGKTENENFPAINITWTQAHDWAKSKGARLPTEAEWEFAARGGNLSKNYVYSGSDNLNEVGWYGENSNFSIRPTGQKKANELGIHDMSGNVWEWCSDWYSMYPANAVTNPKGPNTGNYRVMRGGAWNYDAQFCRVASRRNNYYPSSDGAYMGFRVAFGRE